MALGDTTHVDTSAANTPSGPLGRWFHEISHCHSLENVPGSLRRAMTRMNCSTCVNSVSLLSSSIAIPCYTLNHCVRCALRHIYLFKLTHIILCSSIYPSIHIVLKTRWICISVEANMKSICIFTLFTSLQYWILLLAIAQHSHAQSISININQYHSISFNINQSYLRSLSFAILSLYLSRSHRSGQPDAGALQPRELLPRRQSHLPRRTGRNRRCLEEDPSLCPQHLPGASGASGAPKGRSHITRTSGDKRYELMMIDAARTSPNTNKCKQLNTSFFALECETITATTSDLAWSSYCKFLRNGNNHLLVKQCGAYEHVTWRHTVP